MKLDQLTPLQLDTLREVGGIGAGHAATALSQLVDRPISLEVPRIEVVSLSDVPRMFGGAEELVGAVYARMLGDIDGGILFMADRGATLALVDLMHGREPGATTSIGHEEESLLRHIASILISAYLAAIARMADLDVLPADPVLAFDMAGALLEAVICQVGVTSDMAVLVRTSFLDEESSVDAVLFFMPESDGLSVLLGRLGMA